MILDITSADNPRVRLVRKLATRKGRSEEGLFTAEGINLVSEIIARDMQVEFLMVPEDFEPDHDARHADIAEYMNRPGNTVLRVDRRVFDRLTDAEHGVDVLAVVKKEHLGIDYLETLDPGLCVLVCDRVQDPGNIGTMIRTAAAAGYGAVVLMSGTSDVYAPKVLRATAGTVFSVPIVYAGDEDELFDMIHRTSRRIVVTDPRGGTVYYKESLKKGVALVIGNEGAGVSDSIMQRADVRVTLPMKAGIESLNAAAAAAILMYEAIRT